MSLIEEFCKLREKCGCRTRHRYTTSAGKCMILDEDDECPFCYDIRGESTCLLGKVQRIAETLA